MTLQEFGKKIKTKYPQYNDLPDEVLGQKMLQKYPQYADIVEIPKQQKPKLGAAGAIAGFTGGKDLAVGGAKILGGEFNQLKKSGEASTRDVNSLIERAKTFPIGDKRRTQLLEQAKDISKQVSDQASQLLTETPTERQVVGSAAKLGLTVATLGGAGTGGSLASQVGKGAAIGSGFGLASGLEEDKKGNELVAPTAVGGVLGGSIPLVAQGIKVGFSKVLPKISQALEKSNLRLTPVQKTNLKNKLDDVTKFMSEKKIVGTPETRFEKVDAIYGQTEKRLQSFLETNNTAKGIFVSKKELIKQLESLSKKLVRDNSDAPVVERQIRLAIENISDQYRLDKIPIARLNALKRTTFQNAYTKAGDKVLDTVEHDIGDILRSNIEKATKGLTIDGMSIGAFNKMYGTIINARKLLKIAQGRNQLGLFGRIVSGLVGGSVSSTLGGGPIGGAVGFGLAEEGANRLATPVRSGLSAGLQKTSELAQSEVIKQAEKVARRLALPVIFRK